MVVERQQAVLGEHADVRVAAYELLLVEDVDAAVGDEAGEVGPGGDGLVERYAHPAHDELADTGGPVRTRSVPSLISIL